MVVRNSAPEEFACIQQSKRIGDVAIEIERTQIHFLSNVFVAVNVVVSLSPPYCCEIGRCFKLVISNFLFQACKEVRFVPHKMSNRTGVSICWRYALMTLLSIFIYDVRFIQPKILIIFCCVLLEQKIASTFKSYSVYIIN